MAAKTETKTATKAPASARVSLERVLSKNGMFNLVELAQTATSDRARSYWAGVLAREVNYTAR